MKDNSILTGDGSRGRVATRDVSSRSESGLVKTIVNVNPGGEFSPELPGPENTSCPGQISTVLVDASCFTLPYDFSLCQALQDAGSRVMLARSKFLYDHWEPPSSFDSWQHFYELTHGAGSAHSRRWLWKLAKGAEHVVGMERFCRAMRKLKPDVIHFQWLPLPALDRLFLSRLGQIAPLVLTLHNTKFSRFGISARLQQQTGIRSVFRRFGALIVHSEFSKQKVVESNWASADRVHVVHHGPLEYYRELKMPAAPVAGGEQVVLFFGTTERYKGIDVLLRAFADLPKEVLARTRLLIAGQPRAGVEAAQDLSKQLGVGSRVTWDLRFIGEEEVSGLFRSATVVVLPYREIDQSGVLMTAIAFEKAIIASRVGGIPETIQNGIHGFLVPPEDPGQLGKALQEVLTNPKARLAMEGEVRKLRTGALSWKHSARQTLDVYRTVMAASPRKITDSDRAGSICEPDAAAKQMVK